MGNHRKADPSSSLASVWIMAAGSLAATGESVWVAWGSSDARHVTGAVLGLGLAVALGSQAVTRAYGRDMAPSQKVPPPVSSPAWTYVTEEASEHRRRGEDTVRVAVRPFGVPRFRVLRDDDTWS